ncbi:MAG TPA: BON domain-containing protein [Terracidiphilus sp.]|jgi:osmotically-inducible protein OsmY|nr:BON domain-containing protein [Terracidiphilus sp.]
MFRVLRFSRTVAMMALLAGSLACLPLAAWSAPAQSDSDAAAAIQKKLSGKQFSNVKASVDSNGIATLTGTVDLYEYKMDADKRAHKVKGVNGVRNDIEVAGPSVSDEELKKKLSERLTYDAVGYGHTFDAIAIGVQDGVVTLAGHVHNYIDRDSALALASTYPGVKQVNDDMQVDPTSLMDDRIRMEVARAVYGFPSLNKYAINPARPIRISVQNGHVELSGAVDSKADKDTAGIRANSVPGIFSVQNDLQVVGQPPERSEK